MQRIKPWPYETKRKVARTLRREYLHAGEGTPVYGLTDDEGAIEAFVHECAHLAVLDEPLGCIIEMAGETFEDVYAMVENEVSEAAAREEGFVSLSTQELDTLRVEYFLLGGRIKRVTAEVLGAVAELAIRDDYKNGNIIGENAALTTAGRKNVYAAYISDVPGLVMMCNGDFCQHEQHRDTKRWAQNVVKVFDKIVPGVNLWRDIWW